MSDENTTRLRAVIRECGVHARRIRSARQMCASLFPLVNEAYGTLSENDIAYIDQLVYRYTKLQDVLGAKLFPMIVGYLREDADSLTVLDRLAYLERARAIDDAERWQELREIRNQLAHEYEDDVESAVGYLNDLFETSAILLRYHEHAIRFVEKHILSEHDRL